MKLYLVRHGDYISGEDNPKKPLSEKGIKDIEKIADYSKRHMNIQIREIWHSGKLRALQTANILAQHIEPLQGKKKIENLNPMDPPSYWANVLKKEKDNLMMVGHLPFMAKLVALLVTGDENNNIIRIQMGQMVCLIKENNEWKVHWVITPEDI